jgi:hypothetical protein
MNAVTIFLLLTSLCIVVYGQKIVKKIVEGPVDKDDNYWVIKGTLHIHFKTLFGFFLVSGPVNRPVFQSYIHFYSARKDKSEFDIDCSTSELILYYENDIIIRTTGHLWTDDESYYITLDEGVLYSDSIQNSTEYLSPKFWQFNVVRAREM